MEHSYAAVLDKLGVPELVRLEEDRDIALRDILVKTVFYSNVPNGHESDNEGLLYRGQFEGKDGLLSDYMEIINLNDVLGLMKGINGRDIATGDVEDIRRKLLTGVYSQGKYLNGLRRYQLSIGPYISIPAEEVSAAFDRTVGRLNSRYESVSMTLLNASEFYADFTKLHPFEDGDGRTGRLMANYYLIRGGVKPLHVSGPSLTYWPQSSHPYYFGECTIPEVISTIVRIMDSEAKMKILAERAKALNTTDPHELSVKDHILIQTGAFERGEVNRDQLRKDAERIYKVSNGSEELAVSALWICTFTRTDSKIVSEAMKHPNPGLRANALYAMADIDFAKYKEEIIRAAFEDPSSIVRMSAVGQLNHNGRKVLDMELANRLLDSEMAGERSQSVMVAIAKFVSLDGKTSKEVNDFAKRLIESGVSDLRIRGYLQVMKNCDDNTIVNVLRAVTKQDDNGAYAEPEQTRKGVVIELRRAGKLNNPKIASFLADRAVSDGVVRESLLGDLVVTKNIGEVSKKYDALFETILQSDHYPMFDKIYSMYMLGRRIGFEALVAKYDLDETEMKRLDKIALNLVKFKDMAEGRLGCMELFVMFNDHDEQVLLVSLVELGKLVREGSIPEIRTSGLAGTLAKHLDMKQRHFEERMELNGILRNGEPHERVVELSRLFNIVSGELKDISRETAGHGAKRKVTA